MVAGVLLNFVLAIIIYAGIAFHWGDRVVPYQAMTEGLDFAPEMHDAGFRDGDRLLSLDGRPFDAMDASQRWQMVQPGAHVAVMRGTDSTDIVVPDELIKKLMNSTDGFMAMRVPVYIEKLMPGEPAIHAGLREGDRIIKIGNDTTPSMTEFYPALAANKGKAVPMTVVRDGKEQTMPRVDVNEYGKIGIQMRMPDKIFDIEEVRYSLLGAIPRAGRWARHSFPTTCRRFASCSAKRARRASVASAHSAACSPRNGTGTRSGRLPHSCR